MINADLADGVVQPTGSLDRVPREQLDAFSSLSMSMFVDRSAQCLQLFRAQHAELLADAASLVDAAEADPEGVAELASGLMGLMSKLVLHLTLKRGVMGKQMSSDPRGRAVFDQFDRDVAPLRQRASEVAKAYAAPSQIAVRLHDFKQDILAIQAMLEERFRAEERDLFTEFDRYVHH